MDIIIAFLVGGIIGAVAGIFVYRNNTKTIGKVADGIDVIYDKVEDLVDKED